MKPEPQPIRPLRLAAGILAGQRDGRASIDIVKQHPALYYSSGPEWPARMKRITSREPNLDIFGQKLIDRGVGYWTSDAKATKNRRLDRNPN
jgi:hypothetical protein